MKLIFLEACPYCGQVSRYEVERDDSARQTRHLLNCPQCAEPFRLDLSGKVERKAFRIHTEAGQANRHKPDRD